MEFCYRSGQRCTAIKVICVMESVAEELVKKINEKLTKLKVGLPEDNCDITPVVSESSANFIQGLFEDAKAKKAKFHQVRYVPSSKSFFVFFVFKTEVSFSKLQFFNGPYR